MGGDEERDAKIADAFTEEDDLGIRMTTKEKKEWIDLKERLEKDNAASKMQIECNEIIIKLCEEKTKALNSK